MYTNISNPRTTPIRSFPNQIKSHPNQIPPDRFPPESNPILLLPTRLIPARINSQSINSHPSCLSLLQGSFFFARRHFQRGFIFARKVIFAWCHLWTSCLFCIDDIFFYSLKLYYYKNIFKTNQAKLNLSFINLKKSNKSKTVFYFLLN